mmetsp:Transcript_104724/g.312819  ORF Transcript_104724/g.312819 Transcript_104724/m.312819 type:complete len:226 (+) Transcript_104724:299-976(+)
MAGPAAEGAHRHGQDARLPGADAGAAAEWRRRSGGGPGRRAGAGPRAHPGAGAPDRARGARPPAGRRPLPAQLLRGRRVLPEAGRGAPAGGLAAHPRGHARAGRAAPAGNAQLRPGAELSGGPRARRGRPASPPHVHLPGGLHRSVSADRAEAADHHVLCDLQRFRAPVRLPLPSRRFPDAGSCRARYQAGRPGRGGGEGAAGPRALSSGRLCCGLIGRAGAGAV